MEWKQFKEVVDKVKKVTIKLRGETDKMEQICTEYSQHLDGESATPKECKEFDQITKDLAKVKNELKNVQEKEGSDQVLIEFVGATSSGKSSLINALLRERRLPVGFMQTTMCSIKVCTTEQEKWSVTLTTENGEKKLLSETNDEKVIKDLLSQMSGRKHSEDRKELGIHTRSVIQVNWPKDLCKVLPLNVVLFDTPGFGEDEESMKVVNQSSRKADIVVAVMDAMSPSKAMVTKLVKDVNCQFTFGVFTKWDECLKKAKDVSEAEVDVFEVRQDCKKDFQDALENQCEVFFVDVRYAKTNDLGFQQFESKLASSATKLKGESLIKQAKSVNVESTQISQKFHKIVTARKKEKQDSIEKMVDSKEKDRADLKEIFQQIKSAEETLNVFTKDAKEKLIQEFEKAVKSGKSEKVALKEFLDKVNKNIKDSMASTRKEVIAVVNHWTEIVERTFDLNLNAFMSDEFPQLQEFESQKLLEGQYTWYIDPNNLYTNNYVSGAALCGVLLGAGGVAGAWLFAVEAGLLPFAAGGGVLGTAGGFAENFLGYLRFGDKFKKLSPISDYKVGCFKKALSLELENLYSDCSKLITQEITRINEHFSKKLGRDIDWKSREIKRLQEESSRLSKFVKQLHQSRKSLEETGNELDTLLAELWKEIERAEEELQRQIANMETFLY